MPEGPFTASVQTVLGAMTEDLAAAILEYWASNGAFAEEEGREHLGDVVCILVAESGELVGVNAAHEAEVELIGGRRFWLYRSYLLAEAAEADDAMINGAFDALEAEFDPAGGGPIGLCMPLGDPDEMRGRRELVWPETQLMYAGYLPDGRQLRIRYFDEAAIGRALENSPSLAETSKIEYTPEDRYRVLPFTEQDEVGPSDVIEMWRREQALPGGEEEAKRRVHEVDLVVIDRDDGPVAVTSSYLKRNPQLRLDLHHYRAFVSTQHRMSNLAGHLAVRGRELLEERFVTGDDTRVPGIAYEVENEGLKRYFNKALWLPTDFTFIGESESGSHVRVHYFPGGLAPEPPAAQ